MLHLTRCVDTVVLRLCFFSDIFFFFLSVVAVQLDHGQQKSTEWLGKLFLVLSYYVITNNLHIAL